MFRLVIVALLSGHPVYEWPTKHIFTASLTCTQVREYLEDEIVLRARRVLKAPVEVKTYCVHIGDDA